ncbi:MAG: cytochrome b5 domain-containing protein [Sandaracinaceae bacterium]|nr:cytochrome b5 domain-containing protein [Sandaracinaceae bacterium]
MGLLGKIVQNTKFVAKAVRAITRDRVSPPAQAPLPVGEVRDYTAAELTAYDGSDPTRPVLLSIEGRVFDVTPGRSFYGKGGPYEMFAGKECAVALAKMSFDAADVHGDTSTLEAEEREKLNDWRETFEGKYRELGRLLP